jgi:SAM-dependent methyltransferase
VNAGDTNRAWWDERAALHGQDRVYDIAGFLAGASTLNARDHEVVGDVTGRDLVHLQCHTGMDTLSWLRAGAASVTGVDFSAVAVAKARETAEAAGLADRATFVRSDVLALPEDLSSRFDVCFASIGFICWIADAAGWMRSAYSVLRPGGVLGVRELHPLYSCVGSLEPLNLDFPYANDGPRRFNDDSGSYAVPDAPTVHNETVEWAHSLGEMVTAAVDAGFVVEHLGEHLDAESDGRGMLPADTDGRFRLRVAGELLPIEYTLRAYKPE